MAGLTLNPGETNLWKIVQAVIQLIQGRSNAVGSFTLTASATSTTVTAPTCSPSSFIALFPQTADAANDMATTYCVASTGQFVAHHANNARVDRTFGFEVRG